MLFKTMLGVLALTVSGAAFAQDTSSPKKECCCCKKGDDGKMTCCDEKKGDHADHSDHGKMKH
jgi:hypothetical protein